MKNQSNKKTLSLNELIEQNNLTAIIDKLETEPDLLKTDLDQIDKYFSQVIRNGLQHIPSGRFKGWGLLHITAHSGPLGLLKLLIDKGLDIHETLSTGEYLGLQPLEIAILKDRTAIAELLIRSGANVNHEISHGNYQGLRPLSLALLYNPDSDSVVNHLSLYGAADTKRVLNDALRQKWPQSDVLCLAARFGHKDYANLLIKTGCDVNQPMKQGIVGLTPLCMAIKYGLQEVVTSLVNAGAVINTTLTTQKFPYNTPLAIAALSNQPMIGQWLIEQGCTIQIDASLNREAKAFLAFMACMFGQLELLKTLVEEHAAPLDQTMTSGVIAGWTAIGAAVRSNHIEVVEYLIDKGVTITQGFQNKDGIVLTPLLISAFGKHWQMTEFLFNKLEETQQLTHLWETINIDQPQGYTLLQFATRAQQKNIALKLVQWGFDILPDFICTQTAPLFIASKPHRQKNAKATQAKEDLELVSELIHAQCDYLKNQTGSQDSTSHIQAAIDYWKQMYWDFEDNPDEKIWICETIVDAYRQWVENTGSTTVLMIDDMKDWFQKWGNDMTMLEDTDRQQAFLDKTEQLKPIVNNFKPSTKRLNREFLDARNYFLSEIYGYQSLIYGSRSNEKDQWKSHQCLLTMHRIGQRISPKGQNKYNNDPTPPKLRELRGTIKASSKRKKTHKKDWPESVPLVSNKHTQLDAIQQLNDYLHDLTKGHYHHQSNEGQDRFEFEVAERNQASDNDRTLQQFWERIRSKIQRAKFSKRRRKQKKQHKQMLQYCDTVNTAPRDSDTNDRPTQRKALIIPKTKAAKQHLQNILDTVKREMHALSSRDTSPDLHYEPIETPPRTLTKEELDDIQSHLVRITWGGKFIQNNGQFIIDYNPCIDPNDRACYQFEFIHPKAKQKKSTQIACPQNFIYIEVIKRLQKTGFHVSFNDHQLFVKPQNDVSIEKLSRQVNSMAGKLQELASPYSTEPSTQPESEHQDAPSPKPTNHESHEDKHKTVQMNHDTVRQWLKNLCPPGYTHISVGAFYYEPFINKKTKKKDSRNHRKVRIRLNTKEAEAIRLAHHRVESTLFFKGLHNALTEHFEKHRGAIRLISHAHAFQYDLIMPKTLFNELNEPGESRQLFQSVWLATLKHIDQPQQEKQTSVNTKPMIYQKTRPQTFFNTSMSPPNYGQKHAATSAALNMKQVLVKLKHDKHATEVVESHLKRVDDLLKINYRDVETQNRHSREINKTIRN